MKTIQELKKIAEAATPGEWTAIEFHPWHDSDPVVQTTTGEYICSTATDGVMGLRDAVHIATFSPDLVLKLLADHEVMRAALKNIAHRQAAMPANENGGPSHYHIAADRNLRITTAWEALSSLKLKEKEE